MIDAAIERQNPSKSNALHRNRTVLGRGDQMRHILVESLKCFAKQGFESPTYDELIRCSKVSRGSFYGYFPSKEAF